MKRSAPLRRTPLRSSAAPLTRSPLRRVSRRRAGENRTYTRKARAFVESHPVCGVCKMRSSTEIHHRRGRVGADFLRVEFWMAVCRFCHEEITTNPAWAYDRGYSLLRNGVA